MADDLRSPMNSAFPALKCEGDPTDIHDRNRNIPGDPGLARGRDTLSVKMHEGMPGGTYQGLVDEVAEDCVATPMAGQRRSATGEFESRRSVLGQKKR
jgi:hypothetical protein